MDLRSWMYNCDFQMFLYEEKYIRYLVKYASRSEKCATEMSGILRFLVPLNQDIEQSEVEYENVVPVGGQTDDIAWPTIIPKVALKYAGIHNKAW